ncbi:MAG: hypothetical protein H7249_19080 [Chitinophagaceae bacterium]|nr:hypothetical protein [Oligoflexus sp.]
MSKSTENETDIYERPVGYDWDTAKDIAKRKKFGFGFNLVIGLFYKPYYQENNEGYGGQSIVIGLADNGKMVTAACEEREDPDNPEGEKIMWMATFWLSTKSEVDTYEKDGFK